MSIPRTKKKKSKQGMDDKTYNKIAETNYLCLATAIEQLYEDKNWRIKRINKLVDTYCEEMKKIHSKVYTPTHVAVMASSLLHDDYTSHILGLGKFTSQCYMLCIGCLVITLRKLGIHITRCKLIVGTIVLYKKNYVLKSVLDDIATRTGFDVRLETNI